MVITVEKKSITIHCNNVRHIEYFIFNYQFGITHYFFTKPNSTKRSFKYAPAVISSNCFGCSLSTQLSRQSNGISLMGCMKKGMEYREVPHISLGGLITLWMVDFSLLFVSRESISPTLIIN